MNATALSVKLLSLWASTGRAPGLLYALLEKEGRRLKAERPRRLANGLVMSCDLLDHVQRQVYFFGAYEPIEVTLLLSLVEPGAVVVDAGANVGFYSLMLAHAVGPEGRVHAFEPVPENFRKLSRNLEANDLGRRVRANELALWREEETLEFGLGDQHEFNCGGFSAAGGTAKNRRVVCQATSLDAYFARAGESRLDAIKMDIEGAELFALEGARNTVARYLPVICLEVCRSTCEAFGYQANRLWDALRPFGYRVYRVGSTFEKSGWASDFSGIQQQNVLLVPEAKVAAFPASWSDKQIRRRYL